MTISIRRFVALPSSVLFEAIGLVSANPDTISPVLKEYLVNK